MEGQDRNLAEICLKVDGCEDFVFKGRIFSECSWYDEEFGIQTRQKLYVTDTSDQVYYIVRSGAEKSRPTASPSTTASTPSGTVHSRSA